MSDADGPETNQSPYVESTIIMTTVRVVAPFVLTLGLFIMFHGANSPGGGFQGGAVVGSVVLMLAFAFGADPTRAWLDERVIAVQMAAGVVTFAGIGLGAMVLGGQFLEYTAYAKPSISKYGIELVELGIGAIVAGVITGLFFLIDAGKLQQAEEGGES